MSHSTDGSKKTNTPLSTLDLREMHTAHLQSALQGTATMCSKLLESPDRGTDDEGNTVAHRGTIGSRWQPLYREVTSLLKQLSHAENLDGLVKYITSEEKYPHVKPEKFAKHLWGLDQTINSIYDLLDPAQSVNIFKTNFPKECPPWPFDREECMEWLDTLRTFAREYLSAYDDLRQLFVAEQRPGEPHIHPWLMRAGKIPEIETGMYL